MPDELACDNEDLSVKGTGCQSGACARKAVELTSGDLPFVRDSGLNIKPFTLTGRQESAERREVAVSD